MELIWSLPDASDNPWNLSGISRRRRIVEMELKTAISRETSLLITWCVYRNDLTSNDMRTDAQVEREDGNVYLHGPTSAFRHLGKHPRDHSHGLNIYPSPSSRGPLQSGHSRYLPADISLSQPDHDQCLDRFFGYYACWGTSTTRHLLNTGMRSNPLLFKHDMALALTYPYPRTPHYSPMLHNAILAIALGLSDDPYLRLSSTRAIFSTQAKSFIEEEGMTPSVATVQAFAHIASYHSLGAEHNLGWLYIGMALRCGIARECFMCDTC